MKELLTYRDDMLSALLGVVLEISAQVAVLPSTAWHQPAHLGSTTPHFLLSHLRESEHQVYACQLPRLLVEDTPTQTVFDDQAWMSSHYRPDEPASAIVEQLVKLRRHELGWLRKLAPAGWSRLARHPWWGLHTLQWYVEMQLDETRQYHHQLAG